MTAFRRRSGHDAGFVSILLAAGLTVIMAIIALSVDFGGRLRSAARAQAIAESASRAGAQELVLGLAMTGQGGQIDPTVGPVTACNYAATLGITSDLCAAQVSSDGQTITVTVSLNYDPTFLELFIPDRLDKAKFTVTGKATARLINGP